MNVKIITDSACDLSSSVYEKYDIEMVPLTVHLNGEDYFDGKTIASETVYEAMKNGAAPKTSQVTPENFQNVFKPYVEEGRSVLYVGFSSELSGTYQSAHIAKQQLLEEYPNANIVTIDTKCASLGQGLVVLRASQLAQEGKAIEEIIEQIEYHAKHMEHIFTVDNLEYLQRGGRVSKAQAFIGGLLNIKPLLHVEDGKLIPLEKIRGSKKVLKRMFEVMEERGNDLDNQVLAISHSDALDTAENLASLIKEKYSPQDIIIHPIGSAIGAHVGPGTIALFFLNNTHQ